MQPQRVGETAAFKDRNIRLLGADLATQRGWTGVPNFILENKELSMGAKLTYAMFLKYAREEYQCFPGQDRLGKEIGATRQSVNTWIGELSKAELITVQKRGQGKTNLYTVHLKAAFWKKYH